MSSAISSPIRGRSDGERLNTFCSKRRRRRGEHRGLGFAWFAWQPTRPMASTLYLRGLQGEVVAVLDGDDEAVAFEHHQCLVTLDVLDARGVVPTVSVEAHARFRGYGSDTGFFPASTEAGPQFGLYARPGTSSSPAITCTEEPSKSSPIGSNLPPRHRARNASATAMKDRLFSGRAKPWPSSGYSR